MTDIIYILQCKNKKYYIDCCPKSKLVSINYATEMASLVSHGLVNIMLKYA